MIPTGHAGAWGSWLSYLNSSTALPSPPVSHLTPSSQEVTAWPISRPSHTLWAQVPTWDCQIRDPVKFRFQRNNRYFLCGNVFCWNHISFHRVSGTRSLWFVWNKHLLSLSTGILQRDYQDMHLH